MAVENIFPLTREEILEHFQHVFNNPFETRTIQDVWNVHNDEKSYNSFFGDGYIRGYSTATILADSKGEKDYVVFWKYYRRGKTQYAYSFKKRSLFPTILN